MISSGKTAIIIVHYSGLSNTRECIDSIEANRDNNFHIVIVNNSGEDLPGFASRYTVISAPNQGYGAAMNVGMDYVFHNGFSYLVMMNNDALVERDFIAKVTRISDRYPSWIMNPKIVFSHSGLMQCAGGEVLLLLGGCRNIDKNKRPERINQLSFPDFLNGGCIFSQVENIQRVGKFDPEYFLYYEDVDWSYRARKLGYTLAVVPDIQIYHKHSSSSDTRMKEYYMGKSKMTFAKKHLRGLRKAIFLGSSFLLTPFIKMIYFRRITGFLHYYRGALGKPIKP